MKCKRNKRGKIAQKNETNTDTYTFLYTQTKMSERNTQKKIVKWNNKNKSGARDREEKIQRTNIIQFSISLEKYFVATHIFCKSIETFSFSSK